ncbi:MAG: MBL fold metallo-hydrolase [Dictyoglomus sp.]|nr:MBL fold metallo-hydrolase [Dictyoglomus sp.]MCX7941994.1 MBL fold metallo-hydrolase [Dictyoglomaceae bacterium]MDW8188744.1 MBL fold metallo-hydrolase [Dictyoglomus sp.]
MKIRWYGHACFLLTNKEGIKVLTDPFDISVGYPIPDVEPNIVTTSHEHFDHNAVNLLKGKFITLKEIVDREELGIKIKSISSYHDESLGSKRGENRIFVFTIDGIKIAHLGDLGHILTKEDVEKLGEIDVLCVPVGGVYTIDAKQAIEIIEKVNPKIVIPMHYKTANLKFDLAPLENFLSIIKYPIKKLTDKEIEVNKENLPQSTEVWILPY